MLKIFNFLKKETGEVKMVTMRERFEAAQSEMNAVLADMPEMPVLTIDAAARQIEIAAPEQFADEALALPAPDPEETVQNDEAVDEAGEESSADDTAKPNA